MSQLEHFDQLDHRLSERLGAALRGPASSDWLDVRRRASAMSKPRRPRYVLAIAAALVLVAIAAPALAFRGAIVDFLTAAHAPSNVVREFGQMQVRSLPMVDPGIFPARARRVTSVRLPDGTTSVLYVAPTKSGGFCELWTSGGPACTAIRGRGSRILIAVGYSSMDPQLGVDSVEGVVRSRSATVEVVYADGRSTVIPYVWVTAPISAGFFLHVIPEGQRAGKTRPVALVVLDHGRELVRTPIADVRRQDRVVQHTDAWNQQVQTTAEAVWSKHRRLFSLLTRDGRSFTLYVMPSRRGPGRRCFTSDQMMGCEPVLLPGPPVQLRLYGAGGPPGRMVPAVESVLLTGEVARSVRRLELRFQDGATRAIRPREGFVLTELPSSRYRPGHRLVRAVGYGARGRRIGAASFDPRAFDVYPCTKPVALGYGVRRCP
jgi:hypothetical protein